MEIIVTVLYIAICVALFALAIIVHEFGHFIVALKLGLRVEAFSVGFGPVLWKKRVNGVEYRLSAIPLGGYVSIPDVDPEGVKAIEGDRVQGTGYRGQESGDRGQESVGSEERTGAKAAKIPAWKEIAVAVAGPLMNVVLAVVLAVALSLVPSAKFGELLAEIGHVVEDGPAAAAGMKTGDVVVSVGGHPVRTWSEMQTEVQISGGKETEFKVLRGGAEETLAISPRRDEVTGAYYIMALSVTNHAGAAMWMPSRNPLRQLAWDAGSIFRVLKGLVTPKEAKATAGALGGPVMIAEGLYRQVRRDPWDGLGFLRFLNVNLAVLNLLPIPVLDGGLIMFALFALVFRRRVPEVVVKHLTMVFMVLLIGLMGLLVVRDSWRSYKIHTYKPGAAENVHTNADASAESR